MDKQRRSLPGRKQSLVRWRGDAHAGGSAVPTLTVGGRLKVWNNGLLNYNAGVLSSGTLDVATGGRVLLGAGADKTVRAGAVAIAGTGKVDLADNNMVVDYSGASPLAAIKALLLSGYAGRCLDGERNHQQHGRR